MSLNYRNCGGIDALSKKVTDIENLRPGIESEIRSASPATLCKLLTEFANLHHEAQHWLSALRARLKESAESYPFRR